MTVLIKKISNDEFEVTVKARNTTKHVVSISDNIHQKLTKGKINKKTLIEFSFNFLLERESNTSIFSSFELIVISKYFPEYLKTLSEWINNNF